MFPGNDIVSSLIAVQMGGTGGKAKAKTITKNGVYAITDEEKSEGYVGYSPLNVNVPTGANIIPLTVIEPGTYNAADYGCDGFDPVNVSDMYKKLYEQAVGNGEDVTDDNGNNIPNAVTSDDTDDLNEYLKHIEFSPYGGSVTSQGLDGDTSFKFEMIVTKYIFSGGEIRYKTKAKITVTNLLSGDSYTQTSDAYQTASSTQPPFRLKITEVKYWSRAWVQISFQWVNPATGEVRAGSSLSPKADTVGGTAFVNSKSWASTVSQKSEPDEIVDYT